MTERFQLTLPMYEGPMELLVELVQRQEVELAQVDVALVCQEFLEYVEQASALELSLAGEFLVLAATLVALKAGLLFPKDKRERAEAEDRAALLLENIAEYRRVKDLAARLQEIEAAQLDLFPRGLTPAVGGPARRSLVPEGDARILAEAFARLLPRPLNEDFLAEEKVSIADRMAELEGLLAGRERVGLGELVDRRQRDLVVVTFLALMELVRLRRVHLVQADPFLSLWIETVTNGE